MNKIKTGILNFVNLCLMILLFYISFAFCAVWQDWAPALLIIWLLILIIDFLTMEFAFEFVIYFFYLGRENKICSYIYKTMIAIKNLRNTH